HRKHDDGKLLGARQTDLPDRPDRIAKSRRAALVQKHLHPRNQNQGTTEAWAGVAMSLTRRQFIKRSSIAAAGTFFLSRNLSPAKISTNEKLNIGAIGVAHQANYDISNLVSENIVALCDVDE